MDGRPQSGTGQTALFTGHNGPELFGRHFGPWIPVRLRPVLAEHNVMKRAVTSGYSVAFANAYPRGYPAGVSTRRQAAPPLAALSVDALNRHHEALSEGTAVASGIVNDGWRKGLGFTQVPRVTPEQAGRHLANVSAEADLTVYAHYDTDYAGHQGTAAPALRALERVDRFLGGLIRALPDETAVVVGSDHGNIEEMTGGHTQNPVLGIVARKAGVGGLPKGMTAITDVCPYIQDLLAAG